MSEFFIIDRETRDSIIEYLMDRPCREVFNGIVALSNLQQLPLPEAPSEIVEEENQ